MGGNCSFCLRNLLRPCVRPHNADFYIVLLFCLFYDSVSSSVFILLSLLTFKIMFNYLSY
jgi:hypothetical protein